MESLVTVWRHVWHRKWASQPHVRQPGTQLRWFALSGVNRGAEGVSKGRVSQYVTLSYKIWQLKINVVQLFKFAYIILCFESDTFYFMQFLFHLYINYAFW